MKHITLFILVTFFTHAGFFNEAREADKTEYIENDRLCKLFKKKVEIYKKSMRDDVLAKASLESYKHRVELFCKKAYLLKTDLNTTEQNRSK